MRVCILRWRGYFLTLFQWYLIVFEAMQCLLWNNSVITKLKMRKWCMNFCTCFLLLMIMWFCHSIRWKFLLMSVQSSGILHSDQCSLCLEELDCCIKLTHKIGMVWFEEVFLFSVLVSRKRLGMYTLRIFSYTAAPFFLLNMHVVKNCSLYRRHINYIPNPTALRGIVHFGLNLFAWLQPSAKSALIRRLDCNFLRSTPGWIIILWFCILHV